MGMMGGGGGAAPAGGAEEPAQEEAEEKEAPKEKTHYDVELSEFTKATKIKLIKEVRAMLGLGLKEAKDTVESSPCWIKKELLKEDAEAMKEKLESLGAKIRLV